MLVVVVHAAAVAGRTINSRDSKVVRVRLQTAAAMLFKAASASMEVTLRAVPPVVMVSSVLVYVPLLIVGGRSPALATVGQHHTRNSNNNSSHHLSLFRSSDGGGSCGSH